MLTYGHHKEAFGHLQQGSHQVLDNHLLQSEDNLLLQVDNLLLLEGSLLLLEDNQVQLEDSLLLEDR